MLELTNQIIRESNGKDKVIIVSEWTSVLDLFEQYLKEDEIAYVVISGKSPLAARDRIIHEFHRPAEPETDAKVDIPFFAIY